MTCRACALKGSKIIARAAEAAHVAPYNVRGNVNLVRSRAATLALLPLQSIISTANTAKIAGHKVFAFNEFTHSFIGVRLHLTHAQMIAAFSARAGATINMHDGRAVNQLPTRRRKAKRAVHPCSYKVHSIYVGLPYHTVNRRALAV